MSNIRGAAVDVTKTYNMNHETEILMTEILYYVRKPSPRCQCAYAVAAG